MTRFSMLVMFLQLVGACGESSVHMTWPDNGTTQDAGTTSPSDASIADAGPHDGDTGAGEPPDQGNIEDTAVDAQVDMPPAGSPGCGDPAGIPEGVNHFMLDGYMRTYVMRLPENYDPDKPWPVVFALHGNGGDTSYWDTTSGDRNIREVLKDKAILIVAEAIDGQWRDYNADPETWPGRIQLELKYFDELLAKTRNSLCVNNDAIFTMGFSGGGSFSGVLSCYRPDFRAMAVGGSVIYFEPDECVGKSAAWITIGTQELVAGREQFRDYFRDRAGCDATAVATDPDPCTAYENCDPDLPVHYCQHPDGHIWPSFGSQAMWDFFSQFVTE